MVITDLNIIQEKHLKAIHLKVGFVSSLPNYRILDIPNFGILHIPIDTFLRTGSPL
jgi:hypothetical protein